MIFSHVQYALVMRVVSLSHVRTGALMAFTKTGGTRAKLLAMHQLLDFDVAETDAVKVGIFVAQLQFQRRLLVCVCDIFLLKAQAYIIHKCI
jgi:hypothetical protein